MMRRLVFALRPSFAKWKQPNPELGGIDQLPDIKNRDLDKFKRLLNSAHIYHSGQEHPNFEKNPHDLPTLERNQIETRILRTIRDLEIIDVKKVNFKADLRRDLKIDSLNMVALLTSIEHQFTTVFEDNVFEGIKTLDELVYILMRDPKLI